MTLRGAGLFLLLLPAAVRAAPGAGGSEPAPEPSAPPASSTAPFTWRAETNAAFSAGESLLFVIKYGFITGGNATLEVRSTETVHGRDAWRIVSQARTTGAVDVFYKVRDVTESWMDAASLCSHQFHKVMNEGRYHREAESRFDQPGGTFVFWKRSKKSQDTVQGTIPPFVQDILSSLYYVRTRPLTPGQDVRVDVNSGGKTWPLRVEIKGIEKVKVPAGTFTCVHVRPILAGEGLFMQTGNLEVWLTDDRRRMPVLLRSKVMVGSFAAELMEYDFQRTAPRDLLAE
jgi:hypothetical protein